MHTPECFIEKDQERLFEAMLADWSNQFVNVATDRIDSLIDHCQRSVCDSLSLDRSELWQAWEGAEDVLLLTHLHQRVEGARKSAWVEAAACLSGGDRLSERQEIPLRTDAKAFFPWIFMRLRRGETVNIASLEELPKAAALDRELLQSLGTKSMVIIPLSIGGKWLGFVTFATMIEEQRWTDAQISRFRLVGDLLTNALARARTDRALRQSDERLRFLGDGAHAGLLELNLTSGETWVTEKGRELLGLAPDEPCSYEKIIGQIHPEDRASIRQKLEEAGASESEVRSNYRVVMRDGSSHWFACRMRSVGSVPGDSSRLVVVSVDAKRDEAAQGALAKAAAEIKVLKERLKAESEYLREEIKVNQAHAEIIGRSRGIKKVLQQVEQVAPANCPVLITGESGTGKEMIARSIHRLSPRGNRSMVIVNCAALPSGLIESELFGREKGAFTGALSSQAGRFEMADQSTIFLDEVAELPLELQGKLLRVLQEGEFARLGNPKTRKVDVRVLAATNRDLAEEVRKQRFREDLFYRMNVFPIELPPLRERVEDISPLVFAFLGELSVRMGKKITKVPRGVMETLERHHWPGNIRELRNVIERGVIVCTGDTLRVSLAANPHASSQPVTLAEVERQHIQATLEKTGWHIKGPHGAAKILDLKPGTLYSRMRKLGVPHRRQKDGMPT